MAELKNKAINIKDIKSSYIKKEIFKFLNQKELLSMIIYNKKLQKLFVVNIEDYKKKEENIQKEEEIEKEENI